MPAGAQSAYDPVLREVADDTAAATGVRWTEESAGGAQDNGDGCTWFSRRLKSETDLASPSQWDKVTAATEATLRQHGFEAATPSELKGGYTGVESNDSRGARLTISAEGFTTLWISAKVKDPC